MGPLQSPPDGIAWHRRFEARVLLAVTTISVVLIGSLVAVTERVVTNYSLSRSTSDLVAARAAFDRLVQTRASFAEAQTRLVAEGAAFRASLIDGRVANDEATISAMAADYCRKLDADVCSVSDSHGKWIGGTSHDDETTAAFGPVVRSAETPRSARQVLSFDGGLYLVVAEPELFGDELLGVFAAAYRLDDRVAKELAFATNCQVTFVCDGQTVCGSSLTGTSKSSLAGALIAGGRPLGSVNDPPALRAVAGGSYVGGIYSLPDGAPGSALVLLQDWAPTAKALAASHQILLWIGAFALLQAMLAIFAFSRHVTRPLRTLAVVADDIARGRWERRVPVKGPAEARMTAVAFNHMTATLTHWQTEALARERELQIVNERFRSVTDSANDAIISTNAAGTIVFWNQRAEALFGYPAEEAIGRSVSTLVPDSQRAEPDNLAKTFLSVDEDRLGEPIEVAGRRRDGFEVPLELSLSTWSAGADLFYTGIIRDITDRKQAAEALRQRDEQLRQAQKMEAVGRLAGGVAHDFNNLLTGMLGYADLILTKLPAADPLREEVVEIQKAGRIAASLTRDLLAFGRKQVLQAVVLDLNAVISDSANLIRHMLGEDIELVVELDEDAPPIRADRTQMSQVLLNLAANARDAMATGGRLTISTSRKDTYTDASGTRVSEVELTVTDTGDGMSEDVRAHIFEPFFTTKAIGKGTGLGLATVYGVVAQSGGHIWVDSAPGCGATFHLCFPATADRTAVVDTPRAIVDSPRQAGSASGTVLLVEDNDPVRAMARQALSSEGFVVIEAKNGDEALRLVADRLQTIDIVITDVIMPVMGGRELASRLRALRPDLKIVFISGYADEVVVAEHVLDSAAAFIQKPFAPAMLGKTVREVLADVRS